MLDVLYRHCVADGTSYEVGYELGKQLADDNKLINDLTTPLFGGPPLSEKQVEEAAAMFEKYIPNINEEIKGFSDAVGAKYTDMVIYSSYLNIQGGCSHFVVTNNKGDKRKMFHARNYDFHYNETPILITARTKGKNRSTGFDCKVFGRFDGMNEQGLCITTSAADVKHTGKMGNGFIFPMAVRAVLDQCSNLYEAKELLMELPFAEYRNFLISDKTGLAVLVEMSPDKKAYKFINTELDNDFLCSANHFILEKHNDIVPVNHSLVRQKKMEEIFAHDNELSLEFVKSVLSTRYPEGLVFPYYQDGMGTLWSVIFEPQSLSQYVCFGSPESNKWFKVNPNKKNGCGKAIVTLVSENAPNDFWN